MSFNLSMRVALIFAILFAVAPVAHAATDSGIEWTTRLPEGEQTRVEIHPMAGGESVQIVVSVQPEKNKPPTSVRKNFGKSVLAELQRAWGAKAFDIAAWPWETLCDTQVSWKVTVGEVTKVVCRDKAAIQKMGELGIQVQALMAGP